MIQYKLIWISKHWQIDLLTKREFDPILFLCRVSPAAISLSASTKWHVAYHGTRHSSIKSTLESGGLCIPGDVINNFAQCTWYTIHKRERALATCYHNRFAPVACLRPHVQLFDLVEQIKTREQNAFFFFFFFFLYTDEACCRSRHPCMCRLLFDSTNT